jgi:dihydroxyacetone kinase-like protein
MKASRGRASFLGDRSIGHVDPGARSSALIVRAIAETLEPGA